MNKIFSERGVFALVARRCLSFAKTCVLHLNPRALIFLCMLVLANSVVSANVPERRPITAWPIIFDRVEEGKHIKDIMWPFYHYEEFDQTEITKLRPLIYSREVNHAAQSSDVDVLWPLSSFENTPNSRHNYIFPIYWQKQTEDHGYFHLWPLLGWNYSADYTEYSTLYPFFKIGSSADASVKKANFPWPIWGYEQRAEWNKNYLLPFWYRKKALNSSDTLLFPLFYDHQSELEKIRFITPFYSYGQLGESEFTALLPFYASRKGPGLSEGLILPYYWSRDEQREINGIFPLWHSKMWHSKSDGEEGVSWLLPLYYRQYDNHSSKGMLAPYFWKYDEESNSKGLFPLWYSSNRHFAGDPESPHYSLDIIFPFYFNRVQESDHLKFIAPSYHSFKNDQRLYRALYPFYYHYQKPAFEFKSLVPFYYRLDTESEKYLSYFPFYYAYANVEEQTEFNYYFPFYGRSKTGDRVTSRFLLFPLYAHRYLPENNFHSWDVLWPLIHHEYDDEQSSTRVLPFFWRHQSAQSEFLAGFPFYWHYRNSDFGLDMVLPFYASYSRGDSFTRRFIFGPTYISTLDKQRDLQRKDILFPIYSSQKQGDALKRWLLPFYYQDKNKDSEVKAAALFPLPPYYYRKKTAHQEVKHLWPFYGYNRNPQYEQNSIAWPFYVNRKSESEQRKWLIPFFYHKENEQRKTTLATPFGLPPYYYHERAEENFSFHLWPFYGQSRWGSKLSRSIFWPLSNFEKDHIEKSSRDYVLPFWYRKDNPEVNVNGSLFLHWSKTDKSTQHNEKSFLWLLPGSISLARSNHGPERFGHGLFPLYTYQKNADSLEWYFPWLLFKHEEKGSFAEKLSFLWKMVGYKRSGDRSDFRFLWRLIRVANSPEKSELEINPFYYKQTRADGSGYTNILGGIISFEN